MNNYNSAKPPSRAWTIILTALFGIFGAIPAGLHSSKAQRLGGSGRPYWMAFAVTFVVTLVAYAALIVGILVFVTDSADPDGDATPLGGGDDTSLMVEGTCLYKDGEFPSSFDTDLSDVNAVDCSDPHQAQILLMGVKYGDINTQDCFSALARANGGETPQGVGVNLYTLADGRPACVATTEVPTTDSFYGQ